MTKKRMLIIAQGQVQGVGFRPFIWRLANKHSLTGFCRNTSAGVEIEIQGRPENMEKFFIEMLENPPALSRIEKTEKKFLGCLDGEEDFRIMESMGENADKILVAPDVSTCQDCFDDIMNRSGPRYQYPFTNCVNCGPRFSITKSLPYDRPNTVMQCFVMCGDCEREYKNPRDRRFHAQPIACAKCGPALWYVEKNAPVTSLNSHSSDRVLEKAVSALLQGKIIALKGLGGFQLVCDARNAESIARLRKAKTRPHKALAVMARNLESIRQFCRVSENRENLLNSREKPIVLCEKQDKPIAPLSDLIAPDSASIGVMLPYTPLHFLLLEKLRKNGASEPVLVMTSANFQDEPICLSNREALLKLETMADGWLIHNRDILVRVDDSVVGFSRAMAETETSGKIIFRRARGYVPLPIKSPFTTEKSVLGIGAELKSTFSISRNNQIFTSQHIGDLKSPAVLDFYIEANQHLNRLLGTETSLIVHDLHPDFISTSFARELAKSRSIPCVPLQHHAAHAAALVCEWQIEDDALVICLDGSGMGTDGTVWGGEFIKINLDRCEWERVASFENFVLPGGELAIREPWRIARAINSGFIPQSPEYARNLKFIDEMIEKKINCPLSSSCGRIFDAMSAMLGLCENITYEGQAAVRLETAALNWIKKNPDSVPDAEINYPALITGKSMPRLDASKLILRIHEFFGIDKNPEKAAFLFHVSLCNAIVSLARKIAEKKGIKYLGFSGGVLQNSLLAALFKKEMESNGINPLFHKFLPPGDGCISLGQAVWGQALFRNSGVIRQGCKSGK